MSTTSNSPAPISAIDAIAPAFRLARQELFKPFRFGFWARMALVSFFAGEVVGGGGGNFNLPVSPRHGGRVGRHWLPIAAFDPSVLLKMLPWIVAIALASVVIFLVFLYVHSVCRFILFDSVLSGRCSLRQGWARWHEPGMRYFVWIIFFDLAMLLLVLLLIGLPLFAWWRAGIFQNPREHLGLLLGGGFGLLMLLMVIGVTAAIVAVMVKDFLVPIMALANATLGEAWQRFQSILRAEKGAFAGYIGMKILLAIGAGVIFGIIDFFLILIVVVPLAIAVAAVAISSPGGAGAALIVLGILAGVVLFTFLLMTIVFISVPAAIFFQSYTLYFFGSRYWPLGKLLWPAAPAPQASPLPETPPEGPEPLPSPA